MEPNVNEPDTDGWTQLLNAVRTKDSSAPERVRSLVAKGAAITTGDRWSRTTVYWAAKTQSKWSLEILNILTFFFNYKESITAGKGEKGHGCLEEWKEVAIGASLSPRGTEKPKPLCR